MRVLADPVTYGERVIQMFQNALFVFNMVDMLWLNDIELLHRFYGVFVLGLVLKPAYFNISEGTYPIKVSTIMMGVEVS